MVQKNAFLIVTVLVSVSVVSLVHAMDVAQENTKKIELNRFYDWEFSIYNDALDQGQKYYLAAACGMSDYVKDHFDTSFLTRRFELDQDSVLHAAINHFGSNFEVLKKSFPNQDLERLFPVHVVNAFKKLPASSKKNDHEIIFNYKDTIKTLIELGFDVNAQNACGQTPLHRACIPRATFQKKSATEYIGTCKSLVDAISTLLECTSMADDEDKHVHSDNNDLGQCIRLNLKDHYGRTAFEYVTKEDKKGLKNILDESDQAIEKFFSQSNPIIPLDLMALEQGLGDLKINSDNRGTEIITRAPPLAPRKHRSHKATRTSQPTVSTSVATTHPTSSNITSLDLHNVRRESESSSPHSDSGKSSSPQPGSSTNATPRTSPGSSPVLKHRSKSKDAQDSSTSTKISPHKEKKQSSSPSPIERSSEERSRSYSHGHSSLLRKKKKPGKVTTSVDSEKSSS